MCTMRGEFAIKRAPRNAQASTDTLHRIGPGLVEVERHLKCLGIDGFGPPALPAVGPENQKQLKFLTKTVARFTFA